MVRVFRCFGFKSQVVLPVAEEPIAVCTSTNSVYVATSAGCLEVFRLQKGKGWKNVCTLNTEGLAQQLAYSEKENYLATLEMKQYRQQSLTYVKTYLDLNKWDNKKEFLTSLRLAEKTPVILPGQPVLEVIEVLTTERASSICVCSHTGTLAVACYKKINIYLVQEKYSAECSRSYKDIVHSLVIDWGHEVRRVIINESYIAVFSHRYAHVFKLNFHNGIRKSGLQMNKSASLMVASTSSSSSQMNQQQPIDISLLPSGQVPFEASCLSNSTSTSSFMAGGSRKPPPADSGALVSIQNDENYVQWVFSSDHHGSRTKRRSFGQGTRHLAQISGLANMPAPIYLPKLHGNSGINGSSKSLPKVIVHVKDKTSFKNGKVKADTLLYKIAKSGIPWEHLQLLCIYSAEGHDSPNNADSDFCLQSAKCNSKMEMFCYLGNSQEGCLYSLSPPAVQRLSSYRYTSPALQVVISPTMLFVVTKAGIETYTSRAATFALFRRNTFDNIERTIPPVDLEPCLCGLQPFLGAVEVSVIDSPLGTIMESHVILLSKFTESSNTMWSLYALEPYTAMDTYKDLMWIVFSTKYQDSGQEAYLHVLQEAHLILRGPVIDSEIEFLGEYQDLFDESCQKLGDFYAWHPTSDWKLCLPYYNMAGLRLKEALQKVTKLNAEQQAITFRNGKGFLHYLRHKIFGTYDLSDLTQEEGDLILSVFYKCSGLDVSSIILLSQLKNYSAEKVLSMMKDIMKHDQTFTKQGKRSYLNHLACTILHLDLCETDPAEMELSIIPKAELMHICVQHPQLMHSGFFRLSPLAQLMRKSCPSVLLEILVKLHDNGQLAYTTALELLQVKGSLEMYKNAHIKEFLELLLQDKKRMNIFPEISNLLVNIYLQRLFKWEAPGRRAPHSSPSKIHLPQGVGHFAVRHAWLDLLPPFQGAKSYQTVCHYLRSPAEIHHQPIICPCINCNEDLLKLQSLLCSPYAKETLFQTVEIAFESTASVSGRNSSSSSSTHGELHSRLSLDLLCKISIDVCDALDTIVADHPHILAEFCASMLDSQPETWKYLMTKFHDILTTDRHDSQLYRSVFQDLLSKMVDKVQTADLLLLIPPDASVSYFLPYLERRCINDQLDALQKIVVEKGQRLKRME